MITLNRAASALVCLATTVLVAPRVNLHTSYLTHLL